MTTGCTAARQVVGPSFQRDAWLADYATLKLELEKSYSHLAWFGSPEGGVDLPASDRQTLDALHNARSDDEAMAALRGFVSRFHDGHLRPMPAPAPKTAASLPEPPRPTSYDDAQTACAAFGFVPLTQVSFSLPFETLPDFALQEDGLADAFRSGVITVEGVRLGLLRLPRFRAAEFPALCVKAWGELRARGTREITSKAIGEVIDGVWLQTLAARLARFQTEKVAAVVVDVGGNGGGNDLGDWATRAFTKEAVRSAPLAMVTAPTSVKYMDEQLTALRKVLDTPPELPAPSREAVTRALEAFERRKQLASAPACDMSWVWRERRPWATSPCTRLYEAGFLSGHHDYLEPGSLDARVAPLLYWATAADGVRGAWDGPVFVLTNEVTGSSAEMFTALMRDRGIARTVGTRTMGAGCGFMSTPDLVVLPRSRLAFRLPNCVRLRADGTDEVAGIVPDLPAVAQPNESPRALAARVLQLIARERVRP